MLLYKMILDHSEIVPPRDSGMNSQQAEIYAGIILNAFFYHFVNRITENNK